MVRTRAVFGPAQRSLGIQSLSGVAVGAPNTSKDDLSARAAVGFPHVVLVENIFPLSRMNKHIFHIASIFASASSGSSQDESKKLVRQVGAGFFFPTVPEVVTGNIVPLVDRFARHEITPLFSSIEIATYPSEEDRRPIIMFSCGDGPLISAIEQTVVDLLNPVAFASVRNDRIKPTNWLWWRRKIPRAEMFMLLGLFEDELRNGPLQLTQTDAWPKLKESFEIKWRALGLTRSGDHERFKKAVEVKDQ
jgi:hypothetical protein